MIGSLIGGLSSSVELAANGAETIKAVHTGISSKKSIAYVRSRVDTVNKLLDARRQIMSKISPENKHYEFLRLKEDLLNYERDRLIFEFKRWNAHSRSYSWYKNSFYIINASVNMLRFSTILVGYKSFTSKKCGGALGPMLMSSSGLASAGPFLSNKFGSFIETRQKSILNREFPESGALSEEEAQLKYQVLLKLLEKNLDNTTHAPLLQELVNLREEHKGLDTLIFHQTKKIEYTRLVAGQQARTAPLISSMGFASGILTTLGYHAYRNKPKINNRLGFAGDCTVIPAEAIALLATPAAALKAAMYERALSKKNENPSQLLTKRMEELNKLEKILTVSQAAEP